MSGSLIQLVSKGVQDIYLSSENITNSLFQSKYNKHTNFSQAPKRLDITGTIAPGSRTEIKITKQGDLLNYIWLEGNDIIDYLGGTVFELYIGGQIVDTLTYEYLAEIWNIYLPETKVKSSMINNTITQSDKNFFPLHFFFCDNNNFLPLVGIQYHEVSIRVKWGSAITGVTPIVYANYVYLDTPERTLFAESDMELLITQVQYEGHHVSNGTHKIDISNLNHPTKALFFGHNAEDANSDADYFTFDSASVMLNGETLVDRMSPSYYHTVQGYYHTKNGNINLVNADGTPFYTRYFMYSFADDVSEYSPTGECNFSRIDNATIVIDNLQRPVSRSGDNIYVYAINYNILKISKGLCGILFSN